MPRHIDERLRDLINREPLEPTKKRRKRRKRKLKKGEYPIDPTRLDECSDSELVEIAQYMGFENVSRAMMRDDIISLILGDEDEEPGMDLLAGIRRKIFAYVEGNRSMMPVAQMRCDLHCPTCPHQMVVDCYTVNQDLVD